MLIEKNSYNQFKKQYKLLKEKAEIIGKFMHIDIN